MYLNFQQNRVSRSVKTVPTNLFEKIANCITFFSEQECDPVTVLVSVNLTTEKIV